MGTKVRLLVGSDSAGFDYKDAILADMKSDDRVESVEDLGVYAGKLEDGFQSERWETPGVFIKPAAILCLAARVSQLCGAPAEFEALQ